MKTINGKALRITIGKNITTLRNSGREKQTETALAMNIDPSVISRIEKGTYESLTLEQLVDLCNHFRVTLQDIMGAESNQVFNYSQNNQPGTTSPALTNELSGGYILYINDLKEELRRYKIKVGEIKDGDM